MSHLDPVINAPGPKRLLSIDGGGIRGLIAIEFIARMEALLRERFGQPHLVLSQYFDYIAGTSTGAIIGTLISLGYSAADIRRFYTVGAHTMFDPNLFQRAARRTNGPFRVLLGVIGQLFYRAMYQPGPLEREIKQVLDDPLPGEADSEGRVTTLGTEKLHTLLLIVTRNASTDSPWPLSNNPRALYNLHSSSDGTPQGSNLDIPLWKLVRASTAAPIYFPAEKIVVPGPSGPKEFTFMDGGITVYNNPAFQLFLMATLPPYNLGWRASEREMLLVSVGTGLCESANLNLSLREMTLLYNVQSTPAALMRAATIEQDTLCRIFGRVRPGCVIDEIDSEIGDLLGNRLPLEQKLFTYVRYNVELSEKGLQRIGVSGVDAKAIQPLDNIEHLDELGLVGGAAAQHCVRIEDFDGFLDPALIRPRESLLGAADPGA